MGLERCTSTSISILPNGACTPEANRRLAGLSFVCTDPEFQGQGAGSLLTRAVLGMADADRLPVYLESTENAVPMYEKFGFAAIDAFEMDIPDRRGADMPSMAYREVCMVRSPPELR